MGNNFPFKEGIRPTNVVGGYPTNPTQGLEIVNHNIVAASELEAIALSAMRSKPYCEAKALYRASLAAKLSLQSFARS